MNVLSGYRVMSTFSNEHHETAFHVRDCYIWSEIQYLDSPTDYRECLSQHGIYAHNIASDDLVFLDSSTPSWAHRYLLLLAVIVMALIFGLLLWYDLS